MQAVAINQTNTTGTNVFIHGGNGTTGYADMNVVNATHGQLINQTLTGWVCATNQCNLTVIIDNDLFNATNWTFRITNFTRITGIYYNASDNTWRNITELPAIGQGSDWNWTRNSSQTTIVNYTLAGGDGYDYGVRDSAVPGSYWIDNNNALYGRVNLTTDFLKIALMENEFNLFNYTGGLIFNISFNATLVDNQNLTFLYGYGPQNKTVYFFDWKTDDWKVWFRNTTNSGGNTTAGVPDWTDTRFKQSFKFKYQFLNDTATRPAVNFTFFVTASDPFVRIFVDAKNATSSATHNTTIPINLANSKTMRNYTDKNAEYFVTSGGATEEVYFATQNWKNNTHNFHFRNSSTILNYTYDFNSTLNNNFLFSLGYFGVMSTTNFDATQNQTGFSNETLEQVANSTLTYYDLQDNKLVGWWKFNDGSGTVAIDSSGFNNSGVLNANVTRITNSSCLSGFGYCLSFNGSRNNITIPDSSSLDIGGDKLTISVWVNLRATGAQVIVRKSVNAYNLSFDSSTLPTFYVNTTAGGNQVSDTVVPPTNAWTHIAGVYDGNTIRIYVNGSERACAPNNGTINASSQDLIIGSNDWTGNNLNALLDNAKIFARALTAKEVFWEYQSQKENYPNWFKRDGSNTGNINITHVVPTSWNYDGGAAAVWHFDEGGGNFTADLSGNNNAGNLGNNSGDYRPSWVTNSSCKFNNCLAFNGSQFLNISDSNSLDLNISSIEVWIKASSSHSGYVVSKNYAYRLAVNSDNKINATIFNGAWATPVVSSTSYSTTDWTHVVFTYDGNQMKLYVNGRLDGALLNTTSVNASARRLLVGAANLGDNDIPDAGNYFRGYIDEVRFYSRALTDYEVYEHYSREVSKYYDDFNVGSKRNYGVEDSNTTNLQPITPQDTVFHLRFNDNSTVNATDSSGYGNNGRVVTTANVTWLTNSSCQTNFGGCMRFVGGGSNGRIEVPYSAILNITKQITLASWVYPTSSVLHWIVSRYGADNANQVWAISLTSQNRFSCRVYNTSQQSPIQEVAIDTLNRWYHLACVYDGTSLKSYINGVLVASPAHQGDILGDTTEILTVGGARTFGDQIVNGTLDEILVINRSLSADEIYQLYLGGYNRTINNRTHRIASADGIATTAYNLTDHDDSAQQDYDQRKLLITGNLPEGIINFNASKYKRGDMTNITINVSSDIVQQPTISLVFPNGTAFAPQLHNETTAGVYKTNYTFRSYDPSGNYTVNVTDDTYFTNSTNKTMTNRIVLAIESPKMTEARRIISRPNQDVYTFGRAYYESDNSSVNSTQMNASYQTSAGTTLLGTNETNSSGDYMFTFRFTYPINFTYIVAINDTNNNQGSNSTTVTFTTRALFAKFVNAYRIGTSKTNDAWRLGTSTLWNFTVGSSDPNTRMDASNLTLPYICTYDQAQYSDGIFLSLIHLGDKRNLEYVNFSNTASEDFYRTELKQTADGASTLLAFGKGNCGDVDGKLGSLSGQKIPSTPIGTYTLGEVTTTKVEIKLQYDRLLINGTDRFGQGNNKLCIKNVKITAGNEPLIDVRRC